MSRNTTALLTEILLILAMIALLVTGFYAEYWLFFGGISQMYQAGSWLSVDMIQGTARMICAGPVTVLFGLAFAFLMQCFDVTDEWRKGRA